MRTMDGRARCTGIALRCRIPLLCFISCLLAGAAFAQRDVVTKAMQDELERSIAQLRLPNLEKPYFIAYRLDDIRQSTVAATLGSLTQNQPMRRRTIGVELRVGDYALDNSNYLSTRTFGAGMGRVFSAMMEVPLDDNYQAVRRQFWLVTDAEYKKALEDFSAKRAAMENRKRTEEVPDFSKELPATVHEAPSGATLDRAAAESLVRELSAMFRQMPEIFTSTVELQFHNTYTRYVNSEGTAYTRAEPLLTLEIRAGTQAADGMPLQDTLDFYANALSGLPARDKLETSIREMRVRLTKLRAASFVDRYNGPVLFEGEAAAEVLAQVFAPALVASRTPMTDNPQSEMVFEQVTQQMGGGSLLEKIGGRVLPDFVDLVDNPLLEDFGGAKLAGHYRIDDEGVPARETKLVEEGILKTLLTTRTPVPTLTHSTGNRRGMAATPGNLVLTAQKTSTEEDLRKELLRRAKLRGKDYGIIVRRVGAGGLNSFAQMAMMMGPREGQPATTLLEVYKVFADGHEEPVRGAEVAGLTPAAFRDIVGIGNRPVVYSDQFMPRGASLFSMGLVSMMDGFPVVSYVVPSLLFEEISLKKTTGPFPRPPMSQAPLFEAGK